MRSVLARCLECSKHSIDNSPGRRGEKSGVAGTCLQPGGAKSISIVIDEIVVLYGKEERNPKLGIGEKEEIFLFCFCV